MRKYLLISLFLSSLFLWWCFFDKENETAPITDDKINSVNTDLNINNQDNKMEKNNVVVNWNTVRVDYVWKLEDWTIFDSSIESESKKSKNYNEWRKYEPLEFTVWAWQMIKWFDSWVLWMKEWEKKTVEILPVDGYWENDPKLVQEVKTSDFFPWLDYKIESDKIVVDFWGKLWTWNQVVELKIWDRINMWRANPILMSADKDVIKLDMNHELAWKKLIFDITLVQIK